MNKIGIIGAMDTEIATLRTEMQNNGSLKTTESGNLSFLEGAINGKNVVVVKSGIGKVNAALCAQRLIIQFGVDAVINTGIAGAIASGLKIFDFVLSSDAIYHDFSCGPLGYKPCQIPQMDTISFPADKTLLEKAENAITNLPADEKIDYIVGRVASGDQFISDKKTKENIIELCNPACTEMEGAAIAHTCYLNKIPFLILRCMSDMADDNVESCYNFNESIAAEKSAKILIEILKEL